MGISVFGLPALGVVVRVLAARFPEERFPDLWFLTDLGNLLIGVGFVIGLAKYYNRGLVLLDDQAEKAVSRLGPDALFMTATWGDGVRQTVRDGFAKYVRIIGMGFPLRENVRAEITAVRWASAAEVPEEARAFRFLIFNIKDTCELSLSSEVDSPEKYLPIVLLGKDGLLDVEFFPALAHPVFRPFTPYRNAREATGPDVELFRSFEFLRDDQRQPGILGVTLKEEGAGDAEHWTELVGYRRVDDRREAELCLSRALRISLSAHESAGASRLTASSLQQKVLQLYRPIWLNAANAPLWRYGTRITCETNWHYWLPVEGPGIRTTSEYYQVLNASLLLSSVTMALSPACKLTWDTPLMNVHYHKSQVPQAPAGAQGIKLSWDSPALLMTGHGYGFRWQEQAAPGRSQAEETLVLDSGPRQPAPEGPPTRSFR